MMKTILFIFTLTIASLASAGMQIVAVVNDKIITSQDLELRKKLLRYLNKVPQLSVLDEQKFTHAVVDAVVNDEVLEQFARNRNIKVADIEIDNFIANLEASNKFAKGKLAHDLASLGVPFEHFRQKVRQEIIRSKITNEMLMRGVEVTKNDVDSTILSSNTRDALVELQIYTANPASKDAYNKMQKLQISLKGCTDNPPSIANFAEIHNFKGALAELDVDTQNIVKDLPEGAVSGVISGEKLRIVAVCRKQVTDFSETDSNYVANFLGSQKLNLKAQKFFQDLRQKAYIKINY